MQIRQLHENKGGILRIVWHIQGENVSSILYLHQSMEEKSYTKRDLEYES